jgi:hypothetical protein
MVADGHSVDPDQLRDHATQLEALGDRLLAVQDASISIVQDDEAYGVLCGWISGLLEERHAEQDRLVNRAYSNLSKAARALRATADDYETADTDTGASFDDLEGQLYY